MIRGKLVGYLGNCGTPYCGGIFGYFCVKCRRYVAECRCGDYSRGCSCPEDKNNRYWAGPGERKVLRELLLADEMQGGAGNEVAG